MPRITEEELEYERSLRSTDPRLSQRQYRPRMAMLEDERPSLAEFGARHQESFIGLDDAESMRIKRSLRNRRSF